MSMACETGCNGEVYCKDCVYDESRKAVWISGWPYHPFSGITISETPSKLASDGFGVRLMCMYVVWFLKRLRMSTGRWSTTADQRRGPTPTGLRKWQSGSTPASRGSCASKMMPLTLLYVFFFFFHWDPFFKFCAAVSLSSLFILEPHFSWQWAFFSFFFQLLTFTSHVYLPCKLLVLFRHHFLLLILTYYQFCCLIQCNQLFFFFARPLVGFYTGGRLTLAMVFTAIISPRTSITSPRCGLRLGLAGKIFL